jgi:hypothetical protein
LADDIDYSTFESHFLKAYEKPLQPYLLHYPGLKAIKQALSREKVSVVDPLNPNDSTTIRDLIRTGVCLNFVTSIAFEKEQDRFFNPPTVIPFISPLQLRFHLNRIRNDSENIYWVLKGMFALQQQQWQQQQQQQRARQQQQREGIPDSFIQFHYLSELLFRLCLDSPRFLSKHYFLAPSPSPSSKFEGTPQQRRYHAFRRLEFELIMNIVGNRTPVSPLKTLSDDELALLKDFNGLRSTFLQLPLPPLSSRPTTTTTCVQLSDKFPDLFITDCTGLSSHFFGLLSISVVCLVTFTVCCCFTPSVSCSLSAAVVLSFRGSSCQHSFAFRHSPDRQRICTRT